jgi:hypothetical protein
MRSVKRFTAMATAVVLINLGLGLTTEASTITFTNEVAQSGTGFGTIHSLLAVKKNTSEFGSALWDGSTTDLQDDAFKQSETQTAQALTDLGISVKFALFFNINEPGNADSVTLHDFSRQLSQFLYFGF